MATIHGVVVLFGKEAFAHPVGAPVVAKRGDEVFGGGEVGEDHCFEIEIDDDIRGEIDIELVLIGAAPATLLANGEDLDCTIVYNPVGKTYA